MTACAGGTRPPWRRNTLDEMAEVIAAAKEGKTLECQHEEDTVWWPLDSDKFHGNFAEFAYRVKQEPVKVKILLVRRREDGVIIHWNDTEANLKYARDRSDRYDGVAEVEVDVVFKPTSSL